MFQAKLFDLVVTCDAECFPSDPLSDTPTAVQRAVLDLVADFRFIVIDNFLALGLGSNRGWLPRTDIRQVHSGATSPAPVCIEVTIPEADGASWAERNRTNAVELLRTTFVKSFADRGVNLKWLLVVNIGGFTYTELMINGDIVAVR